MIRDWQPKRLHHERTTNGDFMKQKKKKEVPQKKKWEFPIGMKPMSREEAEKLQEKLNAEAKEKNIEAPQVAAPVMPEPEKVARSETGSAAYSRKDWTFEVQDAAQVPREYCEVSAKLIRNAVKAGIREIPGVRIYKENKTVLRSA